MKLILNGKEVTRDEWDAQTSRLEEILETRQAPCARTDATFLRGHCNGSQFEHVPHIGDMYRRIAERAGVDPKGKVYKAGLADFPGDPRAWVDGRGDVLRVAEEKGLHCRGAVNYTPEPTPPKEVPLAPDIVDGIVQDRLAAMGPDAAKADVNELRHEVVEAHKPSWSK